MPKITIKECNGKKVFHKNDKLTLEQICRQEFALYETLDNNYYLYSIVGDALIKIASEDYVKLKKFGCVSNRVANEQHILDMLNFLSSNYGIYTTENK